MFAALYACKGKTEDKADEDRQQIPHPVSVGIDQGYDQRKYQEQDANQGRLGPL